MSLLGILTKNNVIVKFGVHFQNQIDEINTILRKDFGNTNKIITLKQLIKNQLIEFSVVFGILYFGRI